MSRRGLGAWRTLREGFFLRRGSNTGVARFPRLSFVLAHWLLLTFVGRFFLPLFRAIRLRRLRIEHVGGAKNKCVFFASWYGGCSVWSGLSAPRSGGEVLPRCCRTGIVR